MKKLVFIFTAILLLLAPYAQAAAEVVNAEAQGAPENAGHNFALTFLWIAILLLVAKISGLIERFGQPSVLGELLAGVILGNLVLLGIDVFEQIKGDTIIVFLAELGVVILLFQIGLESNIKEMQKVGVRALLVACIGVVVPFVLGAYIVGPMLLPGLDFNAYLFLGATLTATSVGITARVFRDLRKLRTPEAQIVLGAAVIDDVLGLIILAVISAMVTVGAVSFGMISMITMKAIFFLVGSIMLGQMFAGPIGKLFSKINTGIGMKFTLALSFGLISAYAASLMGLAPIIGAFAAGLILDPVHFKFFRNPRLVTSIKRAIEHIEPGAKTKISRILRRHARHHVEDLIEPVSFLLVPLFFVVTGMQVRLETLFDVPILLAALGLTFVALVGKVVSGLGAGNVNKWIVGWGMAPRGEVGLIFATIGKSLGVISDEIFSVIIIMVILTTLLTPPILTHLLKRSEAQRRLLT